MAAECSDAETVSDVAEHAWRGVCWKGGSKLPELRLVTGLPATYRGRGFVVRNTGIFRFPIELQCDAVPVSSG